MHKRHIQPRAAGVSPPWLGHTIGVPREANVVQRRANTQPGAAIVSPPWAWVTHLQGRFRKVAGGRRQCAHERQRIRVQRCRKGPTLIPAPTFRDFQSLSSRAGFPRGLTPPALVLLRERLPAKNDFCDAQTPHPAKSGGREPAVARSYDRCAVRSECCSATSEHTTRSSDRQPAVGVGNALARALPQSRGRLPSVCPQTLVQ
jgi:hypothetical protein